MVCVWSGFPLHLKSPVTGDEQPHKGLLYKGATQVKFHKEEMRGSKNYFIKKVRQLL